MNIFLAVLSMLSRLIQNLLRVTLKGLEKVFRVSYKGRGRN